MGSEGDPCDGDVHANAHMSERVKMDWVYALCGVQVALLEGMKATGRLLVLVQALTSPKLAAVSDAAGTVPAPLQVSYLLSAGRCGRPWCIGDTGCTGVQVLTAARHGC